MPRPYWTAGKALIACLILGVALLVGVGIGAASSGSKATSAGTSSSGSAAGGAQTTAPIAASTPRTLIDASGDGAKNTDEFQAPGKWTLSYTYDCSGFGSAGNFIITVDQGNAPISVPVNEMKASGSGQSVVYDSGKLHLGINSECSWHVTGTG